MTVTKIFASIEYIVVLLDSMEDYRLSLGFHTKVGGSGERQRKEKTRICANRKNQSRKSFLRRNRGESKARLRNRNNVSTR